MKITIEGYEDDAIVIEADELILFAIDSDGRHSHRLVRCNPIFMGYVAKITESIFLGADQEKTGDTLWGKVAKKLGLRD